MSLQQQVCVILICIPLYNFCSSILEASNDVLRQFGAIHRLNNLMNSGQVTNGNILNEASLAVSSLKKCSKFPLFFLISTYVAHQQFT